MYYVNKIVGWMLSPLGVFFSGLVFGAVLRTRGKPWGRIGNWMVILALAQVWFFGCGVTTRFIGLPLEGPEAEVSMASLPCVDAIVLLGGGMGVHEKCGRAEMYGGADRVWTAAKAFKAGKAPVVTVSGGGAGGELAMLADLGVDTNRTIVIREARNTEEEARLIKNKLLSAVRPAAGLQPKVALVTSAWHMPRAKMLFERAGLEVVPVPTDYEMHCAAEQPLKFGDFLPNAEALMRNGYAVKEWVARFGYWLKK